MNKFKKWIVAALTLVVFYYLFIANIWVTLSVIASLYVAFKLYKVYVIQKLNKLSGSKVLFRESELGHFVALAAKVAKSDGRVSELEAQLISMMFDDVSKIFIEKEKTRVILKEIFNEEKERAGDTREVAASLNRLLGRSVLKRRQFIGFLIQLAFVDSGIGAEEDEVLRIIVAELHIAPEAYEAMVSQFENLRQGQQKTMTLDEAYIVLGVIKSDDMNTIKKKHRKLVREYHPDIVIAQNKDEAYIEEATAKMQEINEAYKIIKASKN